MHPFYALMYAWAPGLIVGVDKMVQNARMKLIHIFTHLSLRYFLKVVFIHFYSGLAGYGINTQL